METEHITEVDSEPPVYGEMKPIPIESCILNSDDFPYNSSEHTLMTKDNCDDGVLSAEEISSMIMINEGPDALNSIQEDLESSKLNLSIENSSDIKKILTSDLPKTGRFLSTKSLQKLSGAKKVKKNPKYKNEEETDDESSAKKIKKVFSKQNKTSQSKTVENETSKKKLKTKSIKKGISMDKLASKKKSLKIFKKVGVNKNKDLNSMTKVFKKKVLENNSVVKKEGVAKAEESESSAGKVAAKTSGFMKKKSKTENKPKLLISRSGRIRKIKDVSTDFILSKNKEGNILNSSVSEEVTDVPAVNETKEETDSSELPDNNSKTDGKENKSRGDLLQNALSESVESWFDIGSDAEKKGKRARGKVKIIPRDLDDCFEETKNLGEEKITPDFNSSEVKDLNEENLVKSSCLKNETSAQNEEAKDVEDDKVKTENETPSSPNVKDSVSDSEQKEDNIKPEPKIEAEEKKIDNSKSNILNGKKGKSSNRQIMGYKKKRRKPRNITVSSYLKNYGERIDFEVKLDPEDETNIACVPAKSESGETKSQKKALVKSGNTKIEDKKAEFADSEARSPSSENLKTENTTEEIHNPTPLSVQKKDTELKDESSVKETEKELGTEMLIKNDETNKKEEESKDEPLDTKTLQPPTKEEGTEQSEAADESTIQEELSKGQNKTPKKNRRTLHKTKVFGMKNRKKPIWALSKKEKLVSYKKKNNVKNRETDRTDETKVADSKETDKDIKSSKTEDSVSSSDKESSKKIRGRPKKVEILDEAGKENKAGVNVGEKQDCERRKSHREIKLTPKIVDMIATSYSYKRPRKASSSKEEESSSHKDESGSSSSAQKKSGSGSESKTKENESEEPLVAVPSVENYLQSKMEENASSFESSWEPGDLVWARFAGNPFWPALILRDPFSNDEYSKVKYLGRLPRPFVHVQFLADFGRRAWGPELYIMSFNGLEEFEKLKSNLPEVNSFTQRKDLMYQQAFFTPKKMEKHWMEAIKEGESLLNKSKDERITYMKIKYPLVKYAASVANGRLVPNERTKNADVKSPLQRGRKRKNLSNESLTDGSSSDWSNKKKEEESKGTFECVNTSELEEGAKETEQDSPKITLKLVKSPKKGSKRKSGKEDELGEKKMKKKMRKEVPDDDYAPSDSGSNGEKTSETSTNKHKKYFLFKGARSEKACQICFGILENEKIVKCKGTCLGLFHKSCAEKMTVDDSSGEKEPNKGVRSKKRKKLFADGESDNSMDASSKDSDEKEWRCSDCLRGENPCFVCKSRSGNRQRCCVAYCGKFYHQKCLKLYPQTVYNQGAPIRNSQFLQQKQKTESESPHYQILSCPLHVCHTCASDNPADFNQRYLCEKLVKCIKCPSAYHAGNYCVPAGTTILNTSQIICAKHEDPKKKSHVNISWCFICNMGGSLICCEWCPSSFHLDCLNIKPPDGPYICEECESGRFPLYGEVVWVKLGRYRWWPARILFPQEILPNIMALPHKPWEFAVRFYGSNDHYWLNRGRVFLYQEGDSEQKFKGQSHVDKIYQRAVQEATKDYFEIQEERKSRLLGSNTCSLMKPPPYVKIKTNKAVGKVQLGNASQSDPQTCDCDPNSYAPCSPGSVCLNRMLLLECNPNYCNAGSRCGNQSFEKREYPPLEPYRTERRGWGLRSSIDIPKGSFVIEYVGEVIDDEEFKRRMKRKQETKDSNYYFLTIDKDRTIDAGPKGNLARFMNHSCSPNCETQKWTVNGDTRVGLFALRDIPAGTELTFNYNLDCIGNDKKACHCEEENCVGFIGAKVKNDKSEALKNKLMKRSEKESEDECFVCSDGGELMVCDVPNCPKVYHLECVNLTEWPNELWFCPRHQCSLCSKTTKRCCKLCPTAFCFAHLDNNLFSDNQGGILCSKHNTCATKPAQTLRKASYVNRNTPVVEYEKPFAEKYRPPPLKERNTPEEQKEEILMEPNLTDNTPIVVENPLLTPTMASRLSDGVSVQVLYVDEEGQIVSVDESTTLNPGEVVSNILKTEEVPKPIKRKKRTNIPRKKLNPPIPKEEAENNKKSPTPGGINFESLMIKSVEDKILDSKLNMDNIYNIIGGGGGGGEGDIGQTETDGGERCIRDDNNELKPETVSKKEEAEVDRSRRSKYFKIITPEKFIKVSESDSNQKKVTDFNYIEFMHPLRSARSKSKTDENTRK